MSATPQATAATDRPAAMPFIMAAVLLDMISIGIIIPVLPALAAVRKIESVAKRHASIFQRLSAWIAAGHELHVVLGNHDLHLVAQFEGFERTRADDTFRDVMDAPDARELVDWLRARPMMHVEGAWAMVHAGLIPQWDIGKAQALAREVEAALRAPDYRDFFAHMYGSKPERWSDTLSGWDRLRVIVNAMTRMRFCTPDGTMEFRASGRDAPAGYRPWFEERSDDPAVVVGHWSALGLVLRPRLAALDTGCVWGGPLTALRLEDRWLVQVPSPGYQPIKEER